MDDTHWMTRALELAKTAANKGEVPVGAVIVKEGVVIGEAHNQPIANNDASAHAEILAIRNACQFEQNYRLPKSTIYITLEPCAMCAGALVHARLERVVIAAREPRAGAAGSVINLLQHDKLNHWCELEFGLLEEKSSSLLRSFFRARRKKSLVS